MTPAGRRIARQGWRQHLGVEVNHDVEAIVRIVDVASHQAAPRREIIEFLNAMASQHSRLPSGAESSMGEGIVGLQERLAAYRAEAESMFLRHLAKSLGRSGKSATSTNQPRAKVKDRR